MLFRSIKKTNSITKKQKNPQKLGIYNVGGVLYNRDINPNKGKYMSRETDIVVHVIDVEKATAFIKERLGAPADYNITAEEMAVINGKKGLATVLHEGVGWTADADGGIPINYWGINGAGGYVDVTVDELTTLISDKTVNLADHVRVFGDRLESNFSIWRHYALGYPQDKMSLVAGILVA